MTLFLAPSWLLVERQGTVEARDLGGDATLRFDGAFARAVLDGPPEGLAVLRALPRTDPVLGRFLRDLASAPVVPATRGAVLRGQSWRQLFLELGARCNERCVHCYAGSGPERDEALPLEVVYAVLEDARALGFRSVQLTGGDPLLAPTCLPAAERAAELGFPQIELFTNGLALRGRTFEVLRDLGACFAFSFYSHDPAVHDAVTNTPGSHERTGDAIRMAVDAGLAARVAIIALERNHQDLDRTIAYVRSLGVASDSVGISTERGVGRGGFPHGSLAWKLPDTGSQAGGHRALGGDVPRFEGTACVSYDGEVYPCIFSRHLPLGSVHADSLRAILEAPEPLALPERVDRESWRDRLSCRDCQVRSALLVGPPSAVRLVPLGAPRPRPLATETP